MTISVEALRALIRFDASSGETFWMHRPNNLFRTSRDANAWNARFSGRPALCRIQNGYKVGQIHKVDFFAHKVVFTLHTGQWPIGIVDHKDGDRLNNRPDNLRLASRRQNAWNAPSRDGTSQYCGVCRCSRSNRWIAKTTDPRGNSKVLGRFDTEEEAAIAYDKAAREWHGEFARLNFPSGQFG